MNAAETTVTPAIVDSTALREAIGLVLFAVDADGKRPEAYSGVFFAAGNNRLELTATDGRQIARCSIVAESQAWDIPSGGFSLPLAACKRLVKRLKESAGISASIMPDDLCCTVAITVGLIEETEETIAARFPNTSRMFAWQVPCGHVIASDLRTAIRHVISQNPKWNEWHGFECKGGWLRLSRDDGKGGEFSHSCKVRDGIEFKTRVFGSLILRWLELLAGHDAVWVHLDFETKTVQLRSGNRQFVTSLDG